MDHANRPTPALEAAIAIADRVGLNQASPVVLRNSNYTSIHLMPYPVVARVSCCAAKTRAVVMKREVAVAKHLAKAGASVVRASTNPPAGPYFHESAVVTLWERVAHRPAGDRDAVLAAETLQAVQAALANYSGTLPSFLEKVDQCRSLLIKDGSLPSLTPADRMFLLAQHECLRERLAALPWTAIPLHGDPHLGNVLVTNAELKWTDFESVCLGPLEWDLACLPEASLGVFRAIDQQLCAVLRDLRSFCVAVWCWAEPDRSGETREAAEYHLQRLKDLTAR